MVLLSIDWTNLHQLLRTLYDEMMPLCSDMAGVAKGVAGIGALFYVAYRVWQSLSRAEPIDVFPLFRPFVLGLCIMFFPTIVLGTVNGILSPVCSATASLVEKQTFDMNKYQEQKDELEREAMLRDPTKAFLVSDEEFDKKIDGLGWSLGDVDTMINMYGEKAVYDFGEKVRQWFRELLELLFQAASLLIDTLRTFFLIVLSILGPLSFAISVYDGFQSTLTTWLSRYICIYMWLPVSDLFGSILARIQILMLQQDIEQLKDPTFIPDASNSVYCIFMIIGIIGYFTIPTVSSWIIQAGGAGSYGQKVNAAGRSATNAGAAVAGAAGGAVGGRIKKVFK
ncbi:conjugative transposon protein TraJ [Bacteroides reticulotermitis]|uniref:conjugative transposon protein TraJ n=1 Tax=Bacteroides reticulotermitis TaxID=1133319 RepID=UPI003A84517B